MTDRELLELAAKAAGLKLKGYVEDEPTLLVKRPGTGTPVVRWSPLTDDGDALRLAVLLNIDLMNATPSEDGSEGQSVTFPLRGDYDSLTEWHDTMAEKQTATRRAIVRAAAEMADSIPLPSTTP